MLQLLLLLGHPACSPAHGEAALLIMGKPCPRGGCDLLVSPDVWRGASPSSLPLSFLWKLLFMVPQALASPYGALLLQTCTLRVSPVVSLVTLCPETCSMNVAIGEHPPPPPPGHKLTVSAAPSECRCLAGAQTSGGSGLVGGSREENLSFVCLLRRGAMYDMVGKGGVSASPLHS